MFLMQLKLWRGKRASKQQNNFTPTLKKRSQQPEPATTKPDSRNLPSLLWMRKSVVASPCLSNNSYPTVPWGRNNEALWAIQVGRGRASSWESIWTLHVSLDCIPHTHVWSRAHTLSHGLQRSQRSGYCLHNDSGSAGGAEHWDLK